LLRWYQYLRDPINNTKPDFHQTDRIKPDTSTCANSGASHSTKNETQNTFRASKEHKIKAIANAKNQNFRNSNWKPSK